MPSIPNERGLTAAPSRRDQVAAPHLLLQRVRSPTARQRPRPDVAIAGVTGSWRLTVLAAWQAHREYRALAGLAGHRDVAAHDAGELAGDGQAQPGAAEALRGRGFGLAELLEQLGLLLRCHADAGVGDGKLNPVAAVAHPARPQLDLALFGELAGIAQQVEQDLPQPHRVDGDGAKVLLDLDNEAVLVLPGELARRADDLVDQRSELHRLG